MSDLIPFVLLFGIPGMLFVGYKVWGRYTTNRLMQKASESSLSAVYEKLLKTFLPYQYLQDDEKKRFKTKLIYFLEDKIFTGVDELIVTDEMKFYVAAEACLMITNLNGDVYPGLKNIYLMKDVFIPKDNPVNPRTGLPTHEARLGEAWKRGPIVLSWKSIAQGSSVIFHEFSHQLDQQDGSFDGTPELGKNGNYDRWAQVMGKAFVTLRKEVSQHRHSDIDPYGATNEAEFFAVVTESFFTRPMHLKETHPDLYQIYMNYFKLDPSLWVK